MGTRFKDKVAVITGASAGIGAAAARQFVAEGAKVVLAARGAAELNKLEKELGGQAKAVATDVSDPDACENLLNQADAAFGRIDILVNNAGFNSRGDVEEKSVEDLQRVIEVNLKAPMTLSRLVLPYLRKAGGGAIVNVASIAGQIPVPDEAAYSASKAGLRAFTYAMAEELRGSGITVSAVSPGPVETGFIMEELDSVPDIVFAQPMSTADEIAELILDCAADGKVERTKPRFTGFLATTGYLFPSVMRSIRPLMEPKGRKAKAKYREKLKRSS